MTVTKNTATHNGEPNLQLKLTSQAPSQSGYKIVISNLAVFDKFVFLDFP